MEARRSGNVLFLEDFADISRPLEAVRGRFIGDGRWLAPLLSAAEEDGEALHLRMGPSWAGERVAKEVRVTLGRPRERGDALVLPLAWEPTGSCGLPYPVLDGDVELAPLGPNHSRLTLSGSYVPPLGELGHQLDRAVLHRVAQSTVRSFLARVARSLEDEEPSDAPAALGSRGG